MIRSIKLRCPDRAKPSWKTKQVEEDILSQNDLETVAFLHMVLHTEEESWLHVFHSVRQRSLKGIGLGGT